MKGHTKRIRVHLKPHSASGHLQGCSVHVGTAARSMKIHMLLCKLKKVVQAGDRKLALKLAVEIHSLLPSASLAQGRNILERVKVIRRVEKLLAELKLIKSECRLKSRAPTALDHRIENVDSRLLARPDSKARLVRKKIAVPQRAAPRVLGISREINTAPPTPKPGRVYPVWYGTNRMPDTKTNGFTNTLNDKITKGRVDVYIPKAHRFGETSSSFWDKLMRGDLRNDTIKIQNIERLDLSNFISELRTTMALAKEAGDIPHALLFIHGYNVPFEEAAIRAAQIGFDLGVTGATAFFSWPSRGTPHSYPADEAAIEDSERDISRFLVDFAENCGAEKMHIIAHSMGNRGLLRSLQRIAGDAETKGKVKFGQIFLAAPDISRALFLDLAHLYPAYSERTTLYASNADRAVHLSAWIHEAPRAGYFMPYTITAGVDTIAVPDFDVDALGHSYFSQAEALLHDMHDLIHHGSEPRKRQRMEPDTIENTTFWRLRR